MGLYFFKAHSIINMLATITGDRCSKIDIKDEQE